MSPKTPFRFAALGGLTAVLLLFSTSGCQITGASASISSDNPAPALGLSLSPKPRPKPAKRKNAKNSAETSSAEPSEGNSPRRIQLPRTDPPAKSLTPEDAAAD